MQRTNDKATAPAGSRHRGPTSATEVARRAGVSLMTVSRVFNDSPLVAEETRLRVQQVAQELGYQPNMAARVLRTGKAETVGYVISNGDLLRSEFHAESLVAFERVMSPRRLSVTLSAPAEDEELTERVSRLVASSRCGAMVVQSDVWPDEALKLIANLGAPVVVANHPGSELTERLGLSTVGFDNAEGMAEAVRHLVSLGHERIGYLGGTAGFRDAVDREAGFRKAMKQAGLPIREDWIRSCVFGDGMATGAAGLEAMLAGKGPRPTAVACASDGIAAGALVAARRAGLAVPGDLSVVGFDDAHWTRFSLPPLTTVAHSGRVMGRRMGEIILELYDNPDLPARRELLKTELMVRESTAPC